MIGSMGNVGRTRLQRDACNELNCRRDAGSTLKTLQPGVPIAGLKNTN
jgi:hypothetical protein